MFVKTAVLALAAVATADSVKLERRELDRREHDDFRSQMLGSHNWYRAQHSAGPLQWNDGLANDATNWARACSENPRHSVCTLRSLKMNSVINVLSSTGWSSR